ncbi:expressed unknown protein [Seminavis robusta]|uniref:Uncharacterized protein n=1 Tax=Seminavis robusta TaxID=568900 RepID=A0A9N8DAT3_9STRA|nr:expressed unknown protein [Seminavis robusta]|eukprot:Sro68_g038190.1 n/a (132) ;mRNA; r:84393-84788
MTSIHNESNVAANGRKVTFADPEVTMEKTKTSTAFNSAIEKFGGGKSLVQQRKEKLEKALGKKSLIELRKEKLEDIWAAERAIKMVKRNKWKVGGSGYGSGVYKKRVVLDYQNHKDKQSEVATSKKRYELA